MPMEPWSCQRSGVGFGSSILVTAQKLDIYLLYSIVCLENRVQKTLGKVGIFQLPEIGLQC